MSLNYGRAQLSIPGPSIIPDQVLNAMHRASPNIYEGELHDLTDQVHAKLKQVAGTQHHSAIYIGNGHAAWEAAICNSFSKGDQILVLSTGQFGKGWGQMATDLGVAVDLMSFGTANAADPAKVEARLRADNAHKIRAVLTVQTDTASSVQNDIPALRAAITAAGHPALLMVDCIASLGCEPHKMDDWGVDVMVAACQKGLMTPAGVSFVFYNEAARDAGQTADLRTPYWDWGPRSAPDVYYQNFCGTAPTHHIFGLNAALDMLLEEGLDAAWARHKTFAQAVWAALDGWGHGLRANIADKADRSLAVTTVHSSDGDATRLRNWCEENGGLTLGIGLGLAQPGTPSWDRVFRIGHMGHLNIPMVMGMLGTIDAGLKALDIPHGSGALDAAAQVISAHRG